MHLTLTPADVLALKAKATVEHQCIEHLEHHTHEWREPHGEDCYQEWDRCAICGEVYDADNPPDRPIKPWERDYDPNEAEGF